MTDPSSQSAFSLLEVLLAVLVLGIALTVFFSAANQGLAVAGQAREYQISRGLLAELELREPLDLEELEEGELQGSFSHPEYGRVTWTRSVRLEGEEEDRFYRIKTEISRGDGQTGLRESTETFVHQPSAIRGGWVQEPFDDF
ncbi:MAG: prepilin-type N-terminal cleavage/methylation domain-containing protein [Kiritimatiellia bacterium]